LVLFFKKEHLPLPSRTPPTHSQAMPIQPQSNRPLAQRHLAEAAKHLHANRPAAAIPALREAARLLPADAAIPHDLGLACLQCGLIPDAITALRRAITLNPRYADAHLRLGIALEATYAFDDALAAYHRAAALDEAATPDAEYRAGALLDSLGRTADGVTAYRRAEAASPHSTLGRIAAARAAIASNDDARAEALLRAILATEPGNAVVLDLLGNLLADTGNFAEARETLLRSIAQAPHHAGSYYDVARSRRMTGADAPLIAQMRAALTTPGLDAAQRARVHLALAKTAADFGDTAESMRQADAASTLRETVSPFDPAAFEARVDRLIARSTADATARAAASGCDDATPIFIVGLPRSGTTLLEHILSAHPEVHAGGELPFWIEQGLAWEKRDPVPAGFVAESAAKYQRVLRAIAPNARRVTDKMPLNFQWAALIHAAFPRAAIIHCRRHPADTALSIHQTHFNPRMGFPTGGAALVAYIRAYQRLCAHWRTILPPDRFVDIKYETLVSDPEPSIRRMLAACGLTWHKACLTPERNLRPIRTPSKFQARQPITAAAIGKSRAYAPVFGALSPLLDDDQSEAVSHPANTDNKLTKPTI
jgi:tetratricopeptide (TPR) repeat protein